MTNDHIMTKLQTIHHFPLCGLQQVLTPNLVHRSLVFMAVAVAVLSQVLSWDLPRRRKAPAAPSVSGCGSQVRS